MYINIYIYIYIVYFLMIKKIIIIKSDIYIFCFYSVILKEFSKNIINKFNFITFIFYLTSLLIKRNNNNNKK